ncbi:hypothetical protein, partial [Sphingobium sp.]|uniref:hypothetical protein n=1 Tax=Sphingobium sp. TaxID=1912891 RepID=UPI0035C718F8
MTSINGVVFISTIGSPSSFPALIAMAILLEHFHGMAARRPFGSKMSLENEWDYFGYYPNDTYIIRKGDRLAQAVIKPVAHGQVGGPRLPRWSMSTRP